MIRFFEMNKKYRFTKEAFLQSTQGHTYDEDLLVREWVDLANHREVEVVDELEGRIMHVFKVSPTWCELI